jgi:hypothetical protein
MKIRKAHLVMTVLSLAIAAPWAATPAAAACTGSSPTWTATPDRSSVATCVSNARNGDTVNVSAGSASWSSNIDIQDKAVSVIGAGAGKTIIGSKAFTLTNSGSRISGFTFNLSPGSGYFQLEGSVGFRIDHNTISLTSAETAVLAYGQGGKPVEGLIDNNNITYGRVVYYGDNNSPGTAGNNRWAEPLDIATSKAIYVEDNVINWPDGSSGGYLNHMDGNYGCRYVARFNSINGGRFEAHSLQGDDSRGCRLWEIYNNTMTNTASKPGYRPFLIRGGTGMIFHNTTDGRYLNETLDIDNARSFEVSIENQVSRFGMCDGSSFIDGNVGGQHGWPCRDQIGRSTDASIWNYGSPAPAQASYPAFIWRNTNPSGELRVNLNCDNSGIPCSIQSTYHIVADRDYYIYKAGFNGTSGVGEGTLAQRPTTCTVGVGYWATDQGEWNSKHAGADGQLYRCTSANTWTLWYKPYAYPHPLQAGGGGTTLTPPAAPTNVRIIK